MIEIVLKVMALRVMQGQDRAGHGGTPVRRTVYAPVYKRVAKNWTTLKWASKEIQENMGFLRSVRDDVRADREFYNKNGGFYIKMVSFILK